MDTTARKEQLALEPGDSAGGWTWLAAGDTVGSVSARREPYRSKLTLDFAAGDAVIIPGYGGAQGAFFVMSDLLSDNLVFGSIGSVPGSPARQHHLEHQRQHGDCLPGINRAGSTGVSARSRPRDTTSRASAPSSPHDQSAYRALGIIRYPLSRFARVEGTFIAEHSNRVDFTLPVDQPRRVGWIATHFLSYVHDNSLWINSGPIDGGRFSLTGWLSNDFSNSRFDSYLVSGDIHSRYLQLGSGSASGASGVRLLQWW